MSRKNRAVSSLEQRCIRCNGSTKDIDYINEEGICNFCVLVLRGILPDEMTWFSNPDPIGELVGIGFCVAISVFLFILATILF